MKVYKIRDTNSLITNISVAFHREHTFGILNYKNDDSKLLQPKDFIIVLNQEVSTDIADLIVQDSANGIKKLEDGTYVINHGKTILLDDTCYDEAAKEYHELEQSTPRVEWYDFPLHHKIIADTANKLVNSYSGHKIFSLGQTPAWLVKAASMLSSECDFGFIPFSSNFLQGQPPIGVTWPIGACNYKEKFYEKRSKKEYEDEKSRYPDLKIGYYYPSDDLIEKYYDTLDKLYLNPNNILSRYNITGQKTIILDYTVNGNGLASFLSILVDRFKKDGFDINQFNSAIKVVILVDSQEDISLTNIMLGDDKSNPDTIICEHLIAENLPYTQIIATLSAGADEAKGESDRLVPYYSAEKWMEDPIWPEYTETINYITSQLREAIEKICSQNVSEAENYPEAEITSAALANSELAGISSENWADFWYYGGS